MPPSAQPISVLAIDDDLADLEILHRSLDHLADFDIRFRPFHIPTEGIEELARSHFDVVFLDYRLGAVTGLEIFEEIQRIDSDIPVIMLTGQGGVEVAVEVMHAGIADYLPKANIRPESLRRSMTNAMEKSRLRRDLDKYRRDLERTIGDLRARNEEIQGFYHVLSHELKTPLTSAREFISIVLDELAGPVTPDQADYLRTAKKNCDQLRRFLDDILDVTRLETGKLALHPEPHDVTPIIKSVVASLASKANEKGISLSAETAASLPPAMLDEERVVQVLTNLITNALKFTDHGGKVVVRAEVDARPEKMLRVAVVDDGCGIEQARLSRIFDRLYQVREEDFAIQGGLGLGLCICKEIVRYHGGDLGVESEPGKGSTFTFTLPLPSEAAAA